MEHIVSYVRASRDIILQCFYEIGLGPISQLNFSIDLAPVDGSIPEFPAGLVQHWHYHRHGDRGGTYSKATLNTSVFCSSRYIE